MGELVGSLDCRQNGAKRRKDANVCELFCIRKIFILSSCFYITSLSLVCPLSRRRVVAVQEYSGCIEQIRETGRGGGKETALRNHVKKRGGAGERARKGGGIIII